MTTRAMVLVLALGVVPLAACGDDDGDEASAADACTHAETVASLDDEMQGEVNDALSSLLADGEPSEADIDAALDQLRAAFDDIAASAEPLLAAYRSLADELDGKLSEAATTLETFTADFIEKLGEVETEDDFDQMIESVSGREAMAAGQASLTLDEWSREECDVVIAD